MTLEDLIGTANKSATERKLFETSWLICDDHIPFIFRSGDEFTGSEEYIELLTTLVNNDVNMANLVQDLRYVKEAREHFDGDDYQAI